MVRIRPVSDRVAIERHELTEPETGIYITPGSYPLPTQGTVIAVGPGRLLTKGARAGERIPPEVQPGGTVLFGPFEVEARIGDELIVWSRDTEVYAIVDDD